MNRADAITAAISVAANSKWPAGQIYRKYGQIPDSCEQGNCRALLGVPYGRFRDLPQPVRYKICDMLGRYALNLPGESGIYCFFCAGIEYVDGRAGPVMPCGVGKCAGVSRDGTLLKILPMDLWLMIVAYYVHATSRWRGMVIDIPAISHWDSGSVGCDYGGCSGISVCQVCF